MLQVAIALRSASRGYIPDKAFIIVSLAVTAFLLVGWRTGFAALLKVRVMSPLPRMHDACVCSVIYTDCCVI